MIRQVTVITCDVCGAETSNKTQQVMAIAHGSEYEYGVNKDFREVKQRLDFPKLELCNGCFDKLLTEPLFVTYGFHSENKYHFKGEKK